MYEIILIKLSIMKNLKYILSVSALSLAMLTFAQEKKKVNFDKIEQAQEAKKKKVTFDEDKKVILEKDKKASKEPQIFMPEKDDKAAKKWRRNGLKKNKKVHTKKHKNHNVADRKFEKKPLKNYKSSAPLKLKDNYQNLQKRYGSSATWKALKNNLHKKSEQENSYQLIKELRADIFKDYSFGKLSKAEYKMLNAELEQAESEIKKF